MAFARFALLVVHVLAGAVWLGAMAYSLAVVQRRLRQFFGNPVRTEELAVFLASGARWKVIGTMGVLAVSGSGLIVIHGWDHSAGWQVAIVAKVVLLAVAAAVFGWVSWRLWPARVFALPAEIPQWQRRFDLVGGVLFGLVGAEFILGIGAHVVG